MRNICRRVLIVVSSIALLAGMAIAEKRAITEKDLFQFQWIGDPRISPDGSQVVFVRVVVGEKQQYETSLWSVPTSGGELRKLTSGKKDSGPRWSTAGRWASR